LFRPEGRVYRAKSPVDGVPAERVPAEGVLADGAVASVHEVPGRIRPVLLFIALAVASAASVASAATVASAARIAGAAYAAARPAIAWTIHLDVGEGIEGREIDLRSDGSFVEHRGGPRGDLCERRGTVRVRSLRAINGEVRAANPSAWVAEYRLYRARADGTRAANPVSRTSADLARDTDARERRIRLVRAKREFRSMVETSIDPTVHNDAPLDLLRIVDLVERGVPGCD